MFPFDQCFHFSHVNPFCRYGDLPGGCGIFAAVVDAKAWGRSSQSDVSMDVRYRSYLAAYLSDIDICIQLQYTTDLFTCLVWILFTM